MKKANERIITRTIKSTVVNVMYFDMKKMSQDSRQERFSGDLMKFSADEMKAIARERFETADKPVLMAVAIRTEEEKYAISEVDFIKYGHKITKEEEEEEAEEELQR